MAKQSPDILPAGIFLQKNTAVPLYMQVYQQFRDMIASRRLRPGERLPPSRELAKTLGVSRVIISQGFEQLMMEGYIIGKTGSGTFVADVLPDSMLNATPVKTPIRKKHTTYQPVNSAGVQPFQIGTPSLDQFPYKLWQQTGSRVLKDLKASTLGYEDTLGYMPLRKAIAGYLRVSRAVQCEPEQVVVVSGSQQGFNLVSRCLLQPGDRVWMEDPCYAGVSKLLLQHKVQLCAIPVEADGMNVSYALQHYPEAKLAYVTPSQQFPLGGALSQQKRELLLQWAQQHNSWILEDDYDSEFRYEGNPLPSLQGMDTAGRVIYSGTFSKVLFPGLRLAYLVLPDAAITAQFKQVKFYTDRQSPILEQLITTRFMEEGHFLRHIRKMRLLYAERHAHMRAFAATYISAYCTICPSASGMHLLCRLNNNIDSTVLKAAIKQAQLRIYFIEENILEQHLQPAMLLGFTAFSRYQMKTGFEQLATCLQKAVFDLPAKS
ncbi:MocR-like pyridoxine biosynthesis transcription factor PdxR [Deminuibacter soli]|uniref:PLP-dependent aminotransferase family protein n=1 Tax=Deminuibacter soli TaxID=2291815 RepID=A0A3E1NI97_9BACT|nr:PLP-dependent aminotransferase family protein [Deminuibacter soli]RFM27642.1 PLP-dependent aminotransferase family protein [Deminuibacter soli]